MTRVVPSRVHKAHGRSVSDLVGLAALLINCFIVFLTSAKFTVKIPLTEKIEENINKGTHLVIPLDSPGESTFEHQQFPVCPGCMDHYVQRHQTST